MENRSTASYPQLLTLVESKIETHTLTLMSMSTREDTGRLAMTSRASRTLKPFWLW